MLAILIFGAFVFVHELGHFLSAKAFNMKVNDFAIGFGPALFKFTKGETTYAVRAFPLGGYVALDGEDEESDDERSFHKQKIWKRFIVMAAGGVMNLLLGFIVVLIVLGMQQTLGTTTISNFQPQPVSNSVLQVGDQILKINGSRVHIDNDIVFGLVRDEDARVDMQIKRGNELLNLQVPFQMTQNPDGTNSVYIDFTVYPMEKNFFNVAYNGVFYTGSIAKMVWISLGDLISDN